MVWTFLKEKVLNNNMRIFLAAPISGFNSQNEYNEYRSMLLNFIRKLRRKFQVYSEVDQIYDLNDYDAADVSAINDFKHIFKSDCFLLYHPYRMQTSSFVELGYAIALEKKIIIISNPKNLPYIAIGLPCAFQNIKVVSSSCLNTETINKVIYILNAYKD